MKTSVAAILGVICGGAIGFYAGWRFGQQEAYKDVQKQINEVKEEYKKNTGKSYITYDKTNTDVPKAEDTSDEKKVDESNPDNFLRHKPDSFAVHYDQYANLVRKYNKDVIVPDKQTPNIYLITDSEFGDLEDDGFMTQSWVWYTDNIMAEYQTDEIIDNVEDAIGDTWLNVFNDGEDFVYVRNKVRQCDYEIIRSAKSYTEDVLPTKPPTMEERNDL